MPWEPEAEGARARDDGEQQRVRSRGRENNGALGVQTCHCVIFFRHLGIESGVRCSTITGSQRKGEWGSRVGRNWGKKKTNSSGKWAKATRESRALEESDIIKRRRQSQGREHGFHERFTTGEASDLTRARTPTLKAERHQNKLSKTRKMGYKNVDGTPRFLEFRHQKELPCNSNWHSCLWA